MVHITKTVRPGKAGRLAGYRAATGGWQGRRPEGHERLWLVAGGWRACSCGSCTGRRSAAPPLGAGRAGALQRLPLTSCPWNTSSSARRMHCLPGGNRGQGAAAGSGPSQGAAGSDAGPSKAGKRWHTAVQQGCKPSLHAGGHARTERLVAEGAGAPHGGAERAALQEGQRGRRTGEEGHPTAAVQLRLCQPLQPYNLPAAQVRRRRAGKGSRCGTAPTWVQKVPGDTSVTVAPVRGSITLSVFHCSTVRRPEVRGAAAGGGEGGWWACGTLSGTALGTPAAVAHNISAKSHNNRNQPGPSHSATHQVLRNRRRGAQRCAAA